MKTIFLFSFMFLSLILSAQDSFKVDSAGKVVQIKITQPKQPDKVIQVIDTVKYYQGAKGGVYYLRKSKKTGKTYKCYLKKD